MSRKSALPFHVKCSGQNQLMKLSLHPLVIVEDQCNQGSESSVTNDSLTLTYHLFYEERAVMLVSLFDSVIKALRVL